MENMAILTVLSCSSSICDEFQILEVNRWTRILILADIGTFSVPLSAYVLIETHIKGVPIPSSEKYACIRIGHI